MTVNDCYYQMFQDNQYNDTFVIPLLNHIPFRPYQLCRYIEGFGIQVLLICDKDKLQANVLCSKQFIILTPM